MDGKKLYLHIGIEKTGTTSIQYYLHQNREKLKSSNILYPTSISEETGNHVQLMCYALDDQIISPIRINQGITSSSDVRVFREKFKKRFEREIDKFTGGVVILSNEHLSSNLTTIEEIQRLKKFLNQFFTEIKIVVYIREQLSLLASAYSTAIKSGMTCLINSKGNFSDFATWEYFDHNTMLNKWEDVFGIQNIILKVYEREKLFQHDVVQDFCRTLEIPYYSYQRNELNKQLNVKQVEFLRLLNKFIPPMINNKYNPLRIGVVSTLINLDIKAEPISALISKDLYGLFDESNRKINQRYFQKDGDNLFESKFIPREVSVDQTKVLTSEEAIYYFYCIYSKIMKYGDNLLKKVMYDIYLYSGEKTRVFLLNAYKRVFLFKK